MLPSVYMPQAFSSIPENVWKLCGIEKHFQNVSLCFVSNFTETLKVISCEIACNKSIVSETIASIALAAKILF